MIDWNAIWKRLVQEHNVCTNKKTNDQSQFISPTDESRARSPWWHDPERIKEREE